MDLDQTRFTIPAGKLYATPAGGTEVYLGDTDGADIEATPSLEERWKPGRGGLVLAEAYPYKSEVVIVARCQESTNFALEHGLMLQRDLSIPGKVRLIPRLDLSSGATVALRHAPAPVTGRSRALHVARALCLPHGKVPLKRRAGQGDVQAVELMFRVLAAEDGVDFWFEEDVA